MNLNEFSELVGVQKSLNVDRVNTSKRVLQYVDNHNGFLSKEEYDKRKIIAF